MRNTITKVVSLLSIIISLNCAESEPNSKKNCFYPKQWKQWNINIPNSKPSGCNFYSVPVDIENGIVGACCYAN